MVNEGVGFVENVVANTYFEFSKCTLVIVRPKANLEYFVRYFELNVKRCKYSIFPFVYYEFHSSEVVGSSIHI